VVGHPQRAAERSDPRPGTAPTQRAPAPGPQGTVAGNVLGLQSTFGNRAVAALLGRVEHPRAAPRGRATTIQRQEVDPGFQPAGNPLVGLKQGDGLVFGTFDRRTRVRILQQRLNEKTGAGLDEDGMFGPRTSEALATFQAGRGLPAIEPIDPDTADALMDRVAPGGGISGVPPGQEGAVRASVSSAGSKLVATKPLYDVAAETIRRAGRDLGFSSRSSGGTAAANLDSAAREITEASILIASAGAKMVAGGPSASFPIPGGSQLVGLQRGDGLNFGTEDRRPRVVQLQTRLNERMSAGLATDGMFGPKTTEVLHEFQRSIRVPETDIVDQVTADALESGQIGQAVAVPGGAELDLAGTRLAAAASSVQSAGAALAGEINDVDVEAGQNLASAGLILGSGGNAMSNAGKEFVKPATQDTTITGGNSLVSSGTQHTATGRSLRDASTALIRGSGPTDASAANNLATAAGAFEQIGPSIEGAGIDITQAGAVMTPAA
jgi:peptidoglycan hydrolase-like protein with peptidoglycan-binding domain